MTERKDPYAQFNFILEINGLDVAGFTEVSGINSESDIIEYREGSDASTVRKLPALRKVGNITLKRGYTKDLALWEWRKSDAQRADRAQAGGDHPAGRKRQEQIALGILRGVDLQV